MTKIQIKFSSMMVVVLGLNKFNKQCQTKLWNIKQSYGIKSIQFQVNQNSNQL